MSSKTATELRGESKCELQSTESGEGTLVYLKSLLLLWVGPRESILTSV